KPDTFRFREFGEAGVPLGAGNKRTIVDAHFSEDIEETADLKSVVPYMADRRLTCGRLVRILHNFNGMPVERSREIKGRDLCVERSKLTGRGPSEIREGHGSR